MTAYNIPIAISSLTSVLLGVFYSKRGAPRSRGRLNEEDTSLMTRTWITAQKGLAQQQRQEPHRRKTKQWPTSVPQYDFRTHSKTTQTWRWR